MHIKSQIVECWVLKMHVLVQRKSRRLTLKYQHRELANADMRHQSATVCLRIGISKHDRLLYYFECSVHDARSWRTRVHVCAV